MTPEVAEMISITGTDSIPVPLATGDVTSQEGSATFSKDDHNSIQMAVSTMTNS